MAFNVPLYRNPNLSDSMLGEHPSGDAPDPLVSVDWNQIYSLWIDSQRGGSATTYYVDPVNGNNANDGSTLSPFADPTAAYAVMNSGDELVIRGDGIVIEDNDLFAINDREHSIPTGVSRTNRTIIRAETPFGVRLRWTQNTRNFFYEAIRFETNQFMLVDGFIIDWLNDEGDPQYMAEISTSENILTRLIFRRDEVAAWGGFVNMPNEYCLMQDVHGVGGARYGFQVGSGGAGVAGKNIIRRSIARVDFSNSNPTTGYPHAPYSHYGNNSGFLSGESEFQNCFPIDGHHIQLTNGGAYNYTWGGFYHPKNTFDVRHRGCGVINQGGQAGIWVTDNSSSYDYLVEHCAVIGENPDVKFGSRNGIHANINGVANNLTLIDIDGADLNNGISATNTYASDVAPASAFNPPNGADLRYCYGEFGTVWGETGFDQLTTTPLWNFPYEDKIREVFAENLPSPPGHTPSTSTAARGFCAPGETLTRYIAGLSSQPVDDVLKGLY